MVTKRRNCIWYGAHSKDFTMIEMLLKYGSTHGSSSTQIIDNITVATFWKQTRNIKQTVLFPMFWGCLYPADTHTDQMKTESLIHDSGLPVFRLWSKSNEKKEFCYQKTEKIALKCEHLTIVLTGGLVKDNSSTDGPSVYNMWRYLSLGLEWSLLVCRSHSS